MQTFTELLWYKYTLYHSGKSMALMYTLHCRARARAQKESGDLQIPWRRISTMHIFY